MKKGFFNAIILTCNEQNEIFDKGYLIIENDEIIEINHMYCFIEYEDVEWTNVNGYIIMPGMINTHVHCGMIPFRSLADDVKDRLRKFLFPLEQSSMNENIVYHSSKYAICEMLLAGITCFCDMYYFEDSVAKACKDLNVRAFLGETIIDMKTPDSNSSDESIKYCESFIEKWNEDKFIRPIIAPHAPNTNTDGTMDKILNISRKYNVPITIHTAEMDYEIQYFKEKYNKTVIEYLEDKGYFNQKCILAHGILLSDSDIDIISKYKNVSIAHCIVANTKSAKGVAPIKKLIDKNVTVGLGTDGASSGNTLDLFTSMKMVANFHKTYLKDRSVFKSSEIVKMATINGAKVLGINNIVGSLEKSKKADFIIIETNSLNMFPIFDPFSVIVYSCNQSNVNDVFINGKQIVKNKQILNVSIDEIRNDLEKSMLEFKEEAFKLIQNVK